MDAFVPDKFYLTEIAPGEESNCENPIRQIFGSVDGQTDADVEADNTEEEDIILLGSAGTCSITRNVAVNTELSYARLDSDIQIRLSELIQGVRNTKEIMIADGRLASLGNTNITGSTADRVAEETEKEVNWNAMIQFIKDHMPNVPLSYLEENKAALRDWLRLVKNDEDHTKSFFYL